MHNLRVSSHSSYARPFERNVCMIADLSGHARQHGMIFPGITGPAKSQKDRERALRIATAVAPPCGRHCRPEDTVCGRKPCLRGDNARDENAKRPGAERLRALRKQPNLGICVTSPATKPLSSISFRKHLPISPKSLPFPARRRSPRQKNRLMQLRGRRTPTSPSLPICTLANSHA